MKNVYSIILAAITAAISLVPLLGNQAQGAVERMALPPDEKREALCDQCGLKGEDRKTGDQLLRKVADSISDCVCFFGSGGRIKPD